MGLLGCCIQFNRLRYALCVVRSISRILPSARISAFCPLPSAFRPLPQGFAPALIQASIFAISGFGRPLVFGGIMIGLP
jgi:hypothetical protein